MTSYVAYAGETNVLNVLVVKVGGSPPIHPPCFSIVAQSISEHNVKVGGCGLSRQDNFAHRCIEYMRFLGTVN